MNAFFWVVLAATVAAVPYMVRRPEYAVYGAFALSGILMAPSLPVVGSQLAIPDIPIVLSIGIVALSVVSGGRSREVARELIRERSPVRWAFIALAVFLVLAPISVISGAVRFAADSGDGVLTVVNYLYGALMAAAVVFLIDDWKMWQRCLIAWLAGAAVVGVIAATAFAGLGPQWALTDAGHRVVSTLRRVNQLHSYVAPAMALAFAFFFSRQAPLWGRIVSAVLFALAAIALLASGSRTAFIMLAIALAGVAVFAAVFARRSPVIAGVTLAIVALGAAALVALTVVVARDGQGALPASMRAAARPIVQFQRGFDFDTFLGPRAEQLRLVAEHWSDHPVLGVGPANFTRYFEHRHEVHNSYLGVLMEQGIPGFLALLAFLFFVMYAAIRALGGSAPPAGRVLVAMAAFAFILVLIYGLTTFGLRQRVFWLSAGLLLSAARVARLSPSPSISPH